MNVDIDETTTNNRGGSDRKKEGVLNDPAANRLWNFGLFSCSWSPLHQERIRPAVRSCGSTILGLRCRSSAFAGEPRAKGRPRYRPCPRCCSDNRAATVPARATTGRFESKSNSIGRLKTKTNPFIPTERESLAAEIAKGEKQKIFK